MKLNTGDETGLDIFKKEVDSLQLFAVVAPEFRIPKVYGYGLHRESEKEKRENEKEEKEKESETKTAGKEEPKKDNDAAYLIMEYLPMHPREYDKKVSGKDWFEFGRNLAIVHRDSAARAAESADPKHVPNGYGYYEDTYRGLLRMHNQPWKPDWITFFRELRLASLVAKLEEGCHEGFLNHYPLAVATRRLMTFLPMFFDDVAPDEMYPSLLHGDLKRSNWGFLKGNKNSVSNSDREALEVVWFDPTAFWGHHEMELAPMPLFGGPSAPEFYEGYHSILPRKPRFECRQLLYQFYDHLHCLVFTGYPVFLKRAEQKLAVLWDTVAKSHPFLSSPQCLFSDLVPINKINHNNNHNNKRTLVVPIACGSFCPVHLNHVRILDIVKEFFERHHSDTHLVVAGYLSPAPDHILKRKFKPANEKEPISNTATSTKKQKQQQRTQPPPQSKYLRALHRVEMCELAVAESDWISVSRLLLMGKKMMDAIERVVAAQFPDEIVKVKYSELLLLTKNLYTDKIQIGVLCVRGRFMGECRQITTCQISSAMCG